MGPGVTDARWVVLLGAVACGPGGEPATTGDDDDSTVIPECADTVYFDLQLYGTVEDGGAPAASGVTVRIEERVYSNTHGESTTGGGGTFSVDATQLPIVEGCWGWATSFYVVADDGTRTAEYGINSIVTSAWQDGETSADLTGIPLDLGD